MNFALKSPLHVQLEITRSCNHSCNHCYNSWRSAGKRMPIEKYDLLHYQKISDELIKNEVFQLTLTGGEPLLRTDILPDVVEYATKGGIEVSLNTNLSLINKRIVSVLKKRGLKNILGSLISSDRKIHNRISGNNSYGRVMNGIDAVVSGGISLGINMVVQKSNLEQVYQTAELVAERGASHFFATRLNPSPEKPEHQMLTLNNLETAKSLEQLLLARKELKIKVDVLEPLPHCFVSNEKYLSILDRACTAGITWVAISPEGEIRVCTHLSSPYGNILRDGLQKSWQRMQEWREEKFVPDECKKDCAEYPYCGGGCRASAQLNENIAGKDSLMTNPLKEKPKRNPKPIIVSEDDILRIRKELKYRKEDFGVVVYANPKNVAFLNNDGLDVLKKMLQLNKFKISDLGRELNSHESAKEFCTKLLQKGVIIRGN